MGKEGVQERRRFVPGRYRVLRGELYHFDHALSAVILSHPNDSVMRLSGQDALELNGWRQWLRGGDGCFLFTLLLLLLCSLRNRVLGCWHYNNECRSMGAALLIGSSFFLFVVC